MAEMNQTPSWVEVIRAERLRQSSRNPGWAALMSFFIMGLGQVYAGHIDRGLTLLIIQIISMTTGYSLYSKGAVYDSLAVYLGPAGIVLIVYILLVFLVVLWVYNVKDAYYLALFADFRDWTEIEKVIGKFLGDGQPRLLGHQGFAHEAAASFRERSTVRTAETVVVPATARPAVARVVEDDDDLETPVQPVRAEKQEKKGKKGRPRHLTEEKLEELVETERLWRFPARATGIVVVLLILLGAGGYFWYLSHQEIQSQRRPAISFTADWDRASAAKTASSTVLRSLPATATATEVVPAVVTSAPIAVSPVWYEEALGLLRSGDRSAGLAQLEEGLSQFAAPVEVWKAYLSAKREQDVPEAYEEALARFLEKYPGEVDFWIILAKCQFDRREHVEASRSLLKALDVAPNHPRANFWLGVIYRELNLPEDALPPLQKAVKADPLNAEFNRELGMAYLDQFDRVNARRYIMKALSVEPTNEELKTLIKQIEQTDMAGTLVSQPVGTTVQAVPPAVTLPDPAAVAQVANPPVPAAPSGPSPSSRRGHVLYEAPPGQTVESVPAPVQPSRSETIATAKPSEKPNSVQMSQVPSIVTTVTEKEQPVSAPVAAKSATETAAAPDQSAAASVTQVAEKPAEPPKVASAAQMPEETDVPPEALVMIAPSAAPATGKNLVRNATTGNAGPMVSTGTALLFDAELMPERTSAIKMGTKPASDTKSDDEILANAPAVEDAGEPPMVVGKDGSGAKSLARVLEEGRSKYYQGAWEEALPLFLEYLKHRPNGEVYDLVGTVFFKLKMNDDAFSASEHAYQLGYKPPATLIRLGTLAHAMKRYDAGVTYLKEALDKVPHRLDARLTYAACLRGLGEFAEAESIYRLLLAGTQLSPALKSRVEKELQALKKQNPGRR